MAMFFATAAQAQDADKLPVAISISAEDTVGRRLAFYVREEIAKSGSFAVVDEDFGRGFKVELVTIDPGSDGVQTAYSLVILIAQKEGFDLFVINYVGHCGADRVRDCAQRILGSLGEQVETIRQAVKRQSRTGFKD